MSTAIFTSKLSDAPGNRRRATIGTTPRKPRLDVDADVDSSPSRRREKSKSQNDLQVMLGRPITPVTRLEFEIEQRAWLLIRLCALKSYLTVSSVDSIQTCARAPPVDYR